VLHAATGSPWRRRAFADPGATDAIAATVEEASSTALFKAESDCTGDAASTAKDIGKAIVAFELSLFSLRCQRTVNVIPSPIPKPAASIRPGADSAMNAKSYVRMPPESISAIGELRNTGLHGRFQTRSADQAPVGGRCDKTR
jgi:hypothetical protein